LIGSYRKAQTCSWVSSLASVELIVAMITSCKQMVERCHDQHRLVKLAFHRQSFFYDNSFFPKLSHYVYEFILKFHSCFLYSYLVPLLTYMYTY
jgi:hypothetical protein